MRWSATRVRWVLLAGVFLLAAVVAGFFGMARYRAGKIWQRILARNGVRLERESGGVTWSQSSKGRTIFTVHASRATPIGPNKWALHDAVLILYGREKGRDDRIYGSEFDYDQDAGIARALGEVHMDLQTPEPGGKAPAAGARPELGFDRTDAAASDPAVIHVRTSGLVYTKTLGLAATGEPTEFRYRGITCTSRGAEFDSEHSLVRLLAEVRMVGDAKGTPFALDAAHAELDRSAYTADLTSPVLRSDGRDARAANALLHLRKDGTLLAADANGAVEMRKGTEVLSAPQMTASFGKENHPEHAVLSAGVTYLNKDAVEPARAGARTVDLAWDGLGELRQVQAEGAVSYQRTGMGQGAGKRSQMRGEQMVADFVPGPGKRAIVQRLRLTGGAEMENRGLATATGKPGLRDVEVRGDELLTVFGMGVKSKAEPRSLTGTGHTQLEQVGADGTRQQSAGETLEMAFAPEPGSVTGQTRVVSAVQSGSVVFETQTAGGDGASARTPEVTTGRAVKASYTASDGALTLHGSGVERAFVQQKDGQISADQIVLHQGTEDAEASGHVVVTSVGAGGKAGTHVLSSRAQLFHASGLSEFEGEPGRPAQMWQEGSQVRADRITLDSRRHTMAARPAESQGTVQAFFAGASEPAAGKPTVASVRSSMASTGARKAGEGTVSESPLPEAERKALEVTAARMDYDDAHREAVFGGGVRLQGAVGEATAERAVAFLSAATKGTGQSGGTVHVGTGPAFGPEMGGSLERFVMLGAVQVLQPGRRGQGEQLVYTTANGTFAMTGTAAAAPKVTAENGTVVTGTTLLFQNADSTIVVAGGRGDSKAQGPGRVHTELDLKQ